MDRLRPLRHAILLLAVTALLAVAPALAQPAGFASRGAPGPASDGLRLSLVSQSGDRAVYARAHSQRLLLLVTLDNLSSDRRSLTQLRACEADRVGSLRHSDGLRFRFIGDDGTLAELPNPYDHPTDVHPHSPLEIAAGGRLEAVVDLREMMVVSAKLKGLLESSGTVTLTAELVDAGLSSAPVEISLEGVQP